jgi:hypothetical protein
MAAAATVFSLAAVATTTSTPHPAPAAFLAAAPIVSSDVIASVGPAAGSEPAVAAQPLEKRPAHRNFATVEELPPYRLLAAVEVTAPYDPSLPALAFAARLQPPAAAEEVLFSAFAKHQIADAPAVIALARLPQSKPEVVWPINRPSKDTTPLALAYAPAVRGIEAPFDAVLSGARAHSPRPGDIDVYMPRPRPDPDLVLTWLQGRALGQFAPGQHAWVQNPLPDIVFEPKQQKCLAEAIYFEARGESEDGQAAVAQVVLNRVRNPSYPDTICDVVYQNAKMRGRCQFSFACDGRPERIVSQRAWRTAQRIADDVTHARIWLDDVGDSTHYHANYVRPRWGKRMNKMDRIGAHIFYRTRFGGWS